MSNQSFSQTSAPGTPTPRPDGQPGGMASTADAGLSDALQRSAERGDDPATGLASTGNASGGGQAPRTDLGGKDAPGSAPGTTGPSGNERGAADTGTAGPAGADAAPRTAPTASGGAVPSTVVGSADQKDESAVESFGRAVSEVVTAAAPDPVRPVRRP